MMCPSLRALTAVCAFLTMTAQVTVAQCSLQVVPGVGAPGVRGTVTTSTTWDRDGSGPLPEQLVFGGEFALAGDVPSGNLATYDPASGLWATLGSFDAPVRALLTLPNGDLVVAGAFTHATVGSSSSPVDHIARWNGSAWQSIGSLPYEVSAIARLSNGDLVAGGAGWLSIWNGITWTPMSSLGAMSVVRFLVRPNGELLAGWTGSHGEVARWNGISWVSLGVSTFGALHGLTLLPNGDLVAVGAFPDFGGVAAAGIARWNGAVWSALGSGVAVARDVLPLPNGDLIVGGQFATAGGVLASNLAQWNGVAWAPLAGGVAGGLVTTLARTSNGALFAAGTFASADGAVASSVARWQGGNWSALWSGTDGSVNVLRALPGGNLIAGGSFTSIQGVDCSRVARWDGAAWQALGAGITAGPAGGRTVSAVTPLPNGDLVVGGWFTAAGGVACNNVAQWDGVAWGPMAAGISFPVTALATMPNGDVVATASTQITGGAQILRWNGSTWSQFASANQSVAALALLTNGDLVAGGYFTSIGGIAANRIARFDGASWSPLGAGFNGACLALLPLPNGYLAAAGEFTQVGVVNVDHIARWSGAGWGSFAAGVNGRVRSLVSLPIGNIVAGGAFTASGATPLANVARWTGLAWQSPGAGTDGEVASLAALDTGELALGGAFTSVGGIVSASFGRLATTCPATVSVWGPGCPGSGGNSSLSVTSPPWIGTTFATLGSGLPVTSLVVVATGFQGISWGAIPLQLVFPQAGAGCFLQVVPDILQTVLPTGGLAAAQLPLPYAPAALGLYFYQQMVPLEFDGQGNLAAVTATDALQVMVGSF